MANIIIRKINNEIFTSKKDLTSKNKSYITADENCFSKVIDCSVKPKTQELRSVKSTINKIFNNCLHSKSENSLLEDCFEKLKNANSKEDLQDLELTFISDYMDQILTLEQKQNEEYAEVTIFKELTKSNFDLITSVFIKKLISSYFYKKISNFDQKRINNLEYIMEKNNDLDLIFNQLDENFNDNSKENGVYFLSKKILSTVLNELYYKNQPHLCWLDCKNAHVYSCPKIADGFKKNIDEYDFIKDGYQEVTTSGQLIKFIVSNCEKYEKEDPPKKLTSKEEEHIKKLKESLWLSYWNAVDIDEANEIEESMNRKKKVYFKSNLESIDDPKK